MRTFTGLLDTSETATDAAFRVKLYLTDETIEVATFDGDSWKWPAADVEITRVKADRYRLDLGAEALFFLPDDPLSFTLKISPGSESAESGTAKRGWLRRRIEEAAASSVDVEQPSYVPDVDEGSSATRFSLRGPHNHIWEETDTAGVQRRRCVDCGHVSIDLSNVSSSLRTGVLSA